MPDSLNSKRPVGRPPLPNGHHRKGKTFTIAPETETILEDARTQFEVATQGAAIDCLAQAWAQDNKSSVA